MAESGMIKVKESRVIKALSWLIAIPLTLLALPFIIVLIVIYLIYEKIKFIGAPKECCQAGCSHCPWGDLKYVGWRRAYKEWRKTHKHNRQPRIINNEIRVGGSGRGDGHVRVMSQDDLNQKILVAKKTGAPIKANWLEGVAKKRETL